MCKVHSRYIEAPTFTGYKIALKHKQTGKYYSPSTGIEYYERQQMPCLHKKVRNICQSWQNPFRKDFYDPLMQGKTGVFYNEDHAWIRRLKIEKDDFGLSHRFYQPVVLQMTIEGDLWCAYFGVHPTIVGNCIVEFQEISNHQT